MFLDHNRGDRKGDIEFTQLNSISPFLSPLFWSKKHKCHDRQLIFLGGICLSSEQTLKEMLYIFILVFYIYIYMLYIYNALFAVSQRWGDFAAKKISEILTFWMLSTYHNTYKSQLC